MKSIFLFILIFISSTTYSQTVYQEKLDKKEPAEGLNWDKISLNYSPKSSLSRIGFLPKMLNTEQGVEFTFITKKVISLNLKNITLKASSDRTIDINNPLRDTTYYLSDGSLSWTIIHYLNKTQLDFIKKEVIKEIIISVDNEPLEIRLKKKSQILFSESF